MTTIAKKRRSLQPLAINARNPEYLTVLSHQYHLEAMHAMRAGNQYDPIKLTETRAGKDVEIMAYRYSKDLGGNGNITVDIKLDQGDTFDNLTAAILGLGDGVVDTWIAIVAMGVEKNGCDPERIRVPFLVNPDDILELCQKEKSNRSYSPFQRVDIIRHIKILSQITVRATHTIPSTSKRKKDVTFKAEGALLDMLQTKIGAYTTITGDEMWERREICLGPFITQIVEISPLTAIMYRKLLGYSAKNHTFQKRIGQYLTMMYRINAKYGLHDEVGIFPGDIRMQALLDGAHITPERQVGRFRESIEEALAQLKADGVIGNYWQVVDSVSAEDQQKIEQHAKGWFDIYLQTKWNFTAPPKVQEQYQALGTKAQKSHLIRAKNNQ